MADVVLLHSVLGLRPALVADAETLREAGHRVVLPDLYDGLVLDTLDEGLEVRDRIGEEVLLQRATDAVAALPPGQVLGGWSLGGWFAQTLVEQRRDCAGGLFLSSAAPPSEPWVGVPCQVHAATGDEWVDEPYVDALAALGVEVFRYAGGHLFADRDLAGDYDATSAALLRERVLAFLDRV